MMSPIPNNARHRVCGRLPDIEVQYFPLGFRLHRHRRLIAEHHPDRGGDPILAAEINAALEQAEAELGQ